jgi:hypothetical protein
MSTLTEPRVPLTFVLTKHEFHTISDVLDEVARLDASGGALHRGARGMYDREVYAAAFALREALRIAREGEP